ncbi:MAG: ankyrin repeat domain-containing protein [Candidatus Cloacimonetes bacterium]|nr:ankyrin repeat domain-containing protein [Candidatus Cloacimonadota bacterium]
MKNCIFTLFVLLCGFFAYNCTAAQVTEEFMKAVVAGDISKVEQFVKDGVDVNMKSKEDVPILVVAAEHGHLAVLRMLLDYGALPSSATEMGDTALIRAAAKGHEDIILELISRKSDINHANMYMDTALSAAVANDQTNTVRILLEHNADVNVYHVSGCPLLSSTVLRGNMALAKMLIAKGADVNMRTYPANMTMLMLVAIEGDERHVEEIIKLGVAIDAVDKTGYSALMHAVCCSRAKVLQELIRLGANLDIQDIEKKQTALIHAVENEYVDSCALLIAAGADNSLKDLYGGTALARAKATGNRRIIEMLEKTGAKMHLFSEKPVRADAELTLREMENLSGAIMWCSFADRNPKKTLDDVPVWDDITKYLRPGDSLYERKGLDVLGNKFIIGSSRNESRVNPNTVEIFEKILGGEEASKLFWGKYMPDVK